MEMADQLGLVEILMEKFYILHKFWGMSLPEELNMILPEEKKKKTEEANHEGP